jgi:hypothetical protein
MKPRRRRQAEAELGEQVVAYRSGRLYEFDMVADALEAAGVPYFRREESSSGLSFAMPVMPVQGPGITWAILVPRRALRRAKRIIVGLPVSQDMHPGVWGFKPTARSKSFFRVYGVLCLGIVLLTWAVSFFGFCRAR